MYFEDLTPFEYHDGYNGLNVGWLDGEHSFAVGDVSPELLDALHAVIASGQYTKSAAMGIHRCEICNSTKVVVERNGVEIFMGNAEIAVSFEGTTYVAPTLVYHYVNVHRYLPPEGFVQAVLTAA